MMDGGVISALLATSLGDQLQEAGEIQPKNPREDMISSEAKAKAVGSRVPRSRGSNKQESCSFSCFIKGTLLAVKAWLA